MESFFTRYRNLVVLLCVLVAQVIGLAMQVRRTGGGHNSLDANDTRSVRLIRYWAESLVSPPERVAHGGRMGISDLWYGYIDLRHVRQQNKDLEQTVDRLRLEQAELLADAQQGQRLQALLGFEQHYIYSTIPAQVYGSSGSDQSKVFYIDKGSDDGLKRDMPVISSEGIVGKVREVLGGHMAQVLAINDQTSGAGVILETTRIRGVLKGNAAGQLEIVGVMADQRIKPGEKVLTAGGDLIFPRGLPVGVVQKVVPDPDRDSFIDIIVTPAAHLDELDEVLVINSTQPRFPSQQQKDIATSEELKSAQAAAIEEQMKASQIMAERLPGLDEGNNGAASGTGSAAGAAQTGPNGATGQNPAQPPAPKLLPTVHPDRFSPGVANGGAADSASDENPATTKTPGTNGGEAAPKKSTIRPAQEKVQPETQGRTQ
jgi:rod shape-determining protein MreC